MTGLPLAESPASHGPPPPLLGQAEGLGDFVADHLRSHTFGVQLLPKYEDILRPILKEAGFSITYGKVKAVAQRGLSYTFTLITNNWIKRFLLQMPSMLLANPTEDNFNRILALWVALWGGLGDNITLYIFHEQETIPDSFSDAFKAHADAFPLNFEFTPLRKLESLQKMGAEAWNDVEEILNLEVVPEHRAYDLIQGQIGSIKTTIEKIEDVAPRLCFSEIGEILVDVVANLASNLDQSLFENIKHLQEIEDRRQRHAKLPKDGEEEAKARERITDIISKYKKELLPQFEHIIGELLYYKEKNELDLSDARKKLEEAKRLQEELYNIKKSVPDFVRKTRGYVEALLEASAEGMKNVP